MKSTIKVVLCISLFTSTALLTLAGDQPENGGCTGCKSMEPVIEQSYSESTTTTTLKSQEVARPDSNDTNSDIVFTDEVMLILKQWLMNFFD